MRIHIETIPHQEQRYSTARALADDLERWLADDAVTAWREPLPIRMGRWLKRNRTAVASAAAALVALAIGLGIVAAVQTQANRDLRTAYTAKDRALDAAKEAQARTQAALEQSDESRLRAEAVLTFLKKDVLAATRPEGREGPGTASAAAAFPRGGDGRIPGRYARQQRPAQ